MNNNNGRYAIKPNQTKIFFDKIWNINEKKFTLYLSIIYVCVCACAHASEFGILYFFFFFFFFYNFSNFKMLMMVRAVFLAFIMAIVLIGLWFVLIPGFVSVNVLLELIVHENLWPLQMFFSPYIFTRVCSVCLYPCMHIYFQGGCFCFVFFWFFFSFLSLPSWVECKLVCVYVFVWSLILFVCVQS